MRITPLGDALGAEVVGLDAGGLTREAACELEAAFLEHHLLCFRVEPLPAADFVRLARCFGTPQPQLLRSQRVPGTPEVSILESTYARPEDKPDDLARVRLSGWHTDDSYFARPAKATLLQALDVPSRGGETRFADTERAWRELPEALRRRVAGREAVHAYDTPRAKGRARTRTAAEAAETPDVVHPLVRTHDDTGRPAVYFNPNRTDRVVGLDRVESDALLDALYAEVTRPELQHRHRWRVGDILLWDNRCLLHAVNTDYPVGERRRHQRILLAGTVPR